MDIFNGRDSKKQNRQNSGGVLIPLYHPRLSRFSPTSATEIGTTRKFCDENSLSREQSTISLEACEPALTRATHVFLYAIMCEYKFMQIGRPTSDAVSMYF